MELYLVRHAIAEDARPGQPDADRALTADGRARFAAQVEGLARRDIEFGRVLTSPWRRAVETAELLASRSAAPIVHEATLAAAPSEGLLERLAAAGADGRVAAVGHQPWMSDLTAWLVVGSVAGLGGHFAFKKGGIAILEGDPKPANMRLLAFLPPRWTRRR